MQISDGNPLNQERYDLQNATLGFYFVNKPGKGKKLNKRTVVSRWLAYDGHKHIPLPLYP